jgi:hypothetical protein
MLNITFMPKMPSPKACHMILVLLTFLILAPAWVLLDHKHYEAARILAVLGAVPTVALFSVCARGALAFFTCTATASNKTTKIATELTTKAPNKTTDDPTNDTTRQAPLTAIPNPSLASFILIFLSLLANALALWLSSYSHEGLDVELHGVTGMLLVLALVAAVVADIIYVVDLVRAIKMRREQKKRKERRAKGVESV